MENDSEYDYDYENDEHFEKESESELSNLNRRDHSKSLVESLEDIEPGFEGEDYLNEVDSAVRRHTSTHHKQSLRKKRSRNEKNSRAKNRQIRNKKRHDRAESDEEEDSHSNYQENLGRLADYVKSSEY